MSGLLTQGARSEGEYPCTTAEITYFLEAFLIREALLAMPDDLESNERTRYIKAIFVHVVSLNAFFSYLTLIWVFRNTETLHKSERAASKPHTVPAGLT